MWFGRAVMVTVLLGLLVPATARAQQNLGHKVLGTLGLKAGAQLEPGLYVADRVLYYSADVLADRDGHPLPVGLDMDAVSNAIGVLAVFHLAPLSTYLSTAIGMPLTHVGLNTQRPEASIDRFGLGDLYVMPLRAGWRLPHLDVSISYAFYAPTGPTEPGGIDGIGRGQWSSELALGTAVYFDRARTWHLSALTSAEFFSHKLNIDITRGTTVQIQGGLGKTLLRFLDVGIVGYAEWQVSDDLGAALPATLRGAREQAFGMGPEVDLLIAPIRSSVVLRYTHDIAVKSRPEGQLLTIGLAGMLWRPRKSQ